MKNIQEPSQTIQLILQNTLSNLQSQMQYRFNSIDSFTTKINKENSTLDNKDKNNIISHCNRFLQIAPIFKSALQNSQEEEMTKQEIFWRDNEKLERILEEQLRKLKDIDIKIDNIVNEEFDKCNQIDEIQQTIRIILSKKQRNHIQAAEPYYQQKKRCIQFLKEKGLEKQQIKEMKLNLITKILSLLHQLKKHREDGFKNCSTKDDLKIPKEQSAKLLAQTIQSLNHVRSNEQKLPLIRQEEIKMLKSAGNLQTQINKLSDSLFRTLSKQNDLYVQIQRLWKQRNQIEFFNQIFLEVTGFRNVQKNDKNFTKLRSRLQKYLSEEQQKKNHLQRIQQGIETTNTTMSIFDHILKKIETQNMRRRQLLYHISQIQQQHNEQSMSREFIAEMQSEIDKLMVKKNRLSKNLSNKIDEADVTAYKSIHHEIQILDQQIRNKQKQIGNIRIKISQNAKILYDDTISLQEQYSDILSEIVPNYWFRDNDFTKQQAIKDLNLYLMKTFKRLSIAD